MTSDEQLELWLKGESVHNQEREECCPDFSCCKPKLLAPLRTRKAFVAADGRGREAMLMMFLGKAIPLLTDDDIYVAGDPTNYEEPS